MAILLIKIKYPPNTGFYFLVSPYYQLACRLLVGRQITYSKRRRGRETFFIHPVIHTGKKTLAQINTPPLRMCHCLGKACPAPVSGLLPWYVAISWVTSSAKSRFSAARVPMDTCGMWYVERFWKCSLYL
jgi:hypothetical protein